MNNDPENSVIACQNSDGVEIHAPLVKLTRFSAVFELYGSASLLRISESLANFKISVRNRLVYSGRATIRNLVSTGPNAVCDANLDDGSWLDVDLNSASMRNGHLRHEFDEFIHGWQKLYRITPDYKIIIADMQSFFLNLRNWLDQVDLVTRSPSEEDKPHLQEYVAQELAASVIPCINVLFEKFENVAERLEEENRQAHQGYMRRQLHPLILCAPFAYRTFEKPLGYAGDYEMVNMIVRNSLREGESLYAQLVNYWFLKQMPAEAHRNRIEHLKTRLAEETGRTLRLGRPARILNLGCGPAVEVQQFLAESPLSDHAQFTLLDFNDETIQHAQSALSDVSRRLHRRTTIQLQKKSVLQMLKEAARAKGAPPVQYDLVYCAGLFDYLADPICHQLTDIFYDLTAPGGLVLTTNVEPANPMRNGMEHLLDWNLIYRNAVQMRRLKPQRAEQDSVTVFGDETGVNVMLEARKPKNV
jgi:extracellular factor (EF) 3-hydroxypalmitic acid methyl ester biosynthesis protein